MIAALVVSLAMVVMPAGGPQGATWSYPLAGVEATGLKRLTLAYVQTLSGLRAGRVIEPQDVEAARKRLLESGLFASVGYRFRNAGYYLIVTFTVEEAAWQTPVIFDNFVDHTDAQLTAAVARDLPTFDGVIPDNEAALKRVAGALERVARESKDPGTVSYALIIDKLHARHWRLRLNRTSGSLPICSVSATGIPVALLDATRSATAGLNDTDYSRDFVANYVRENLIPALAAQGLDQAKVTGIAARREPPSPGCERGVAVIVRSIPASAYWVRP
jgi:hypothetical protein